MLCSDYQTGKRAEENGFVHQITNIDGENKIFAICNCNVNVCYALRTSQLFNTPNMSRSAYVAHVKTENCVACGRCVEYCPAGAVKLGQKLCKKDGSQVEYPKQPLPSEIPWGPHMWTEDYRDKNRINCYDTGTAPCKTACPAHIAIQGYLHSPLCAAPQQLDHWTKPQTVCGIKQAGHSGKGKSAYRNRSPAITFCEDCGKTYGTVEYGKICPYCGSQRTYLQQGNEFLIKEISGCCLRQGQSVLPEWSAPPPVSAFRLFQEWFKHSVEQRRIYQGGQGKAKEKPAAGIQRHEL